jgi:hypothetical protein
VAIKAIRGFQQFTRLFSKPLPARANIYFHK